MRRLIPRVSCIILIMLLQGAKRFLTPRFARRCLSSKVADESVKKLQPLPAGVKQNLRDTSTDVYLVCDTNMVIDYDDASSRGDGKIAGWREYADKVAARGET